MNWGSVGEWVGGIGTVVAVIVPLILWYHDRKDRKAAEDELRDLRSEAQRSDREAQARSIAGWIEPNGTFVLRNGSALPVFEVQAWWELEDAAGEQVDGDIGAWEAIGPNGDVADRGYRPPGVLTCVVTFRDAAGRWWRRTSRGDLASLPGRPERVVPITEPPTPEIF